MLPSWDSIVCVLIGLQILKGYQGIASTQYIEKRMKSLACHKLWWAFNFKKKKKKVGELQKM